MTALSALLLATFLAAASACTPLYTSSGPLAHHGRRLTAVSAGQGAGRAQRSRESALPQAAGSHELPARLPPRFRPTNAPPALQEAGSWSFGNNGAGKQAMRRAKGHASRAC